MQAMAKSDTNRSNIQAYANKMGIWNDLSEDIKTKFNSGDITTVQQVLKKALETAAKDAGNRGINGEQKTKILEIIQHGNLSADDLKDVSEIMKNLKTISDLKLDTSTKQLKFDDNGPQTIDITSLGLNINSTKDAIK